MSIVVQSAAPGQILTTQVADSRYVKKGTSPGVPISTVSGLGTGVATFLATPSSANLATALTDESGTGVVVFNNAPTLVGDTIISKSTPRFQLNNTVASNYSAIDFANSSVIKWSVANIQSDGTFRIDLVGSATAVQLDGTTGALTLGVNGANLATPSVLVGTNISGTAASLTSGTVTTNANLTGHITSIGNAAVLGSFTSAQLAAAITDGTLSTNKLKNTSNAGVSLTLEAGSGAGSTGSVTGNVQAGKILVRTGNPTSTGLFCTVNFTTPQSTAPITMVALSRDGEVFKDMYVVSESVNGFGIFFTTTAPVNIQDYVINYHCVFAA